MYNMFSTKGNNAVHNVALQTIAYKKAHKLSNEQAWWHFCEQLQVLADTTQHTEATDTDVRECAWEKHAQHFAFKHKYYAQPMRSLRIAKKNG